MTEISAVAAGIHAFSSTAGSMAGEVAVAAAATAATGPAVLAPVFGVIGTEFLAAFTAVHSAHTAAVSRLAGTVASIGVAASTSAAGYDITDASTAASLA
ncbi:type VII secretion target [Rhodococcus sp. 14-2470-1b]|uniref:type VII secretion target n=1 Tax=Rhodococcus sp. 14-2470-1b TaxID=2023149 RepID=UPI00159512BC|nr:type VII secretion target [Rhodococcus sp. 14-2470-1b]